MLDRRAILLVGQNLFFLPRIQNVAGPSGYEVRLTTGAPKFWELYDEGDVALVLVDLEGDKTRILGPQLSGDCESALLPRPG